MVEISNHGGQWSIVLDGRVVGTADAVELRQVKTVARSFVGTINAVWGLVLAPDAYDDPATFNLMKINKAFNLSAGEVLRVDYDGVIDSVGRAVKFAERVVVFGHSIFAKGAR